MVRLRMCPRNYHGAGWDGGVRVGGREAAAATLHPASSAMKKTMCGGVTAAVAATAMCIVIAVSPGHILISRNEKMGSSISEDQSPAMV